MDLRATEQNEGASPLHPSSSSLMPPDYSATPWALIEEEEEESGNAAALVAAAISMFEEDNASWAAEDFAAALDAELADAERLADTHFGGKGSALADVERSGDGLSWEGEDEEESFLSDGATDDPTTFLSLMELPLHVESPPELSSFVQEAEEKEDHRRKKQMTNATMEESRAAEKQVDKVDECLHEDKGIMLCPEKIDEILAEDGGEEGNKQRKSTEKLKEERGSTQQRTRKRKRPYETQLSRHTRSLLRKLQQHGEQAKVRELSAGAEFDERRAYEIIRVLEALGLLKRHEKEVGFASGEVSLAKPVDVIDLASHIERAAYKVRKYEKRYNRLLQQAAEMAEGAAQSNHSHRMSKEERKREGQ